MQTNDYKAVPSREWLGLIPAPQEIFGHLWRHHQLLHLGSGWLLRVVVTDAGKKNLQFTGQFPDSQEIIVYSVAQSCLTVCNPMDCSLLGSSVHGIFHARILERVAISLSRESSRPMDQTHISWISWIGRQILYHSGTWKAPRNNYQTPNITSARTEKPLCKAHCDIS